MNDQLLQTLRSASAHAYGRHGSFSGRKYRRGRNRCSFCGAPKDAKDKNPIGAYAKMFRKIPVEMQDAR